MKNALFFGIAMFSVFGSIAQRRTETQNLIIVTLDGFRWQELFKGANSSLLNSDKYSPDTIARKQFAGSDETARRNSLLPFFWNTIARRGQLYGNRELHSYLNCSNPYWFSYPGYHELLVGAVNKKVCTNRKFENPDATVLQFLNERDEFRNSVTAFSTWDVFPYILNENCSKIPVNAGRDQVHPLRELSNDEIIMNAALEKGMKRTDSITFHLAFEHLKIDRPRVLYIALDETDDNAHHDRYDHYLDAAHRADGWLENLWSWIQSDDRYRNHTTLLITTDHGRGQNSKKTWRHHGRLTVGSNQIWMAVMGPDTPPTGEMRSHQQLYQKQIASSIAALVGLDYRNTFEVGEKIESMIATPAMIAQASPPVEFLGQK